MHHPEMITKYSSWLTPAVEEHFPDDYTEIMPQFRAHVILIDAMAVLIEAEWPPPSKA